MDTKSDLKMQWSVVETTQMVCASDWQNDWLIDLSSYSTDKISRNLNTT